MLQLTKLNGWRRLWIVLAGISLVGTIGFSFYAADEQNPYDYKVLEGLENPKCEYIRTMPTRTKLNPEPKFQSECWDLYLAKLLYAGSWDSKDGYLANLAHRRHQDFLFIVGVLLAVWLVAVLSLYGAGLVVAWVLKGFRRPKT